MNKRLVVLTGVSRGLGRAMLDGFIAEGHNVVGCARNTVTINELSSTYADHRFDTVDVADDDSVGAWAKSVLQERGVPELIVNNAALMNARKELWNVGVDDFSNVIDVNIKGTFHVIRHFIPSMIDAGRGVVANFSSGWGRSASPEVAPYCATKWAIEGMTRALARELPRGLAAVPVNPGIINTDMLQICFGSAASGFPDPVQWAKKAVPFLLGLSASDNGNPMSITAASP